MAPGRSSLVNSDIHEDVICANIFSRLPFKLVTCLKTISGHSCEIINTEMFAAKQARLCPSCTALIQFRSHVDSDGHYSHYLNLISSTPAIVGLPSSKLNFLGCPMTKYDALSLMDSTNGLVCIQHIRGDTWSHRVHTVLIANPATQQAQPIPGAKHHLVRGRAVGLVIDPPKPNEASDNKHMIKIDPPIAELPSGKDNKFKIVQAFPFKNTNDTSVEFRFVTFSSDTGRWVMSSTTVHGTIKQTQHDKTVYASGVLYWDYQEELLWFDVARSAGGIIKMPGMLHGSKPKQWDHHNIDTSSDGKLMCTTTGANGLAIYQLVEGGGVRYLELKHQKGWADIIEVSGEAFQFCHSMKLRNGWQSRFNERWLVKPLGLESERWLYLGVTDHDPRWKSMDVVLLRYDLDSGKVEDIRKGLSYRFNMMPVFGYSNSMAALPQIAEPTSSGGICDGKPGRCICATKGSAHHL